MDGYAKGHINISIMMITMWINLSHIGDLRVGMVGLLVKLDPKEGLSILRSTLSFIVQILIPFITNKDN